MFAARMLYAIKSFLIKKKCGNSSKSLVLWPNVMYVSSSGSSLCCCGYYYFIIFYANISAFCVIAFTRCGHSGRQQYAYVPTYLCGSLTCPWSCVVLCCVLSCPVLHNTRAQKHSYGLPLCQQAAPALCQSRETGLTLEYGRLFPRPGALEDLAYLCLNGNC